MTEATRIGTVLAGYRVEAVLGRGAMSVVYLAEHVQLGRKVALKVLVPVLAEDESFRERFIRESRRAAELDHPNVIPIYDAGEAESIDGSVLYIAMRRVEGSDLKSLLRQAGTLGGGRTLFILEQVASALEAAHARNLVHRDLKPANVLVEHPSDHTYLADFGIAKHTLSQGLTRTGSFVGTVDYAAPEQIEGRPVDGRADVYALGCILYECLAGAPPFDRESEVAVMHAHLSAPPPKLTEAVPSLPGALERAIEKAMAKSPDERFSTPTGLIEAARAAILQRSSMPAPAAASPRPARRGWRRPVLVGAAIAGAAALAAVLAVVFTGGSSPGTGGGTRTTIDLALVFPAALASSCYDDDTTYDGALLTAVCPELSRRTHAFAPSGLRISVYAEAGSMRKSYDLERRSHALETGTGGCRAEAWPGEAAWVHGPRAPGGRRFCFGDGDQVAIVWTHERATEPDHVNVFGVARARASDRGKLLAWWSFWRHRIGRPSF